MSTRVALPLLLLSMLAPAEVSAASPPSRAELVAQVKELEERVSRLEALLTGVSRQGENMIVTGNLQVVNGLGATTTSNGLGNLIIGYNEAREIEQSDDPNIPSREAVTRTGSHFLVIGIENDYNSHAGIVAGVDNSVGAPFSSVLGGAGNMASGTSSTVCGGDTNRATGSLSVVCGGSGNRASGEYGVVTAGFRNEASAYLASVHGGQASSAGGVAATVLGGSGNLSNSESAVVVGGRLNRADTEFSTAVGGNLNRSSGMISTAVGGRHTIAEHAGSTVVGGDATASSGTLTTTLGVSGRSGPLNRTGNPGGSIP